jgi:fumarate reductase subunit C
LLEQNTPVGDKHHDAMNRRSWLISLTSLFFILLQSACTAFMALSGLRLLIGVGSLAAAVAGARFLDSIHGAVVRIPMEIIAVAGSVINLYAIWRVRSLRARPSSQWRVGPVTPDKRRAESIQIALAILTLLLVAVEWAFHIYLHGSI